MTKQQKVIALKLELAEAVLGNEHQNVVSELVTQILDLQKELRLK